MSMSGLRRTLPVSCGHGGWGSPPYALRLGVPLVSRARWNASWIALDRLWSSLTVSKKGLKSPRFYQFSSGSIRVQAEWCTHPSSGLLVRPGRRCRRPPWRQDPVVACLIGVSRVLPRVVKRTGPPPRVDPAAIPFACCLSRQSTTQQ